MPLFQPIRKPHSLPEMFLLGCLLWSLSAGTSAARNLIFIAIDDMREHPQAITPNLDALASQGTHYLNAYTTATWCLPARTSVMFGLSPGTHHVGVEDVLPDYNAPPFTDIYDNPAIKSLPEILSAAGYNTGVAGKVFHDPEPDRWDVNGPAIPWSQFFDLFDPGPDGTFLIDSPIPDIQVHPDQDVADWAVNFINAQTGDFFLAVGFFQPHLPWIAPQWAYDLYGTVTPHTPPADDFNDEPIAAEDWAEQPVFWIKSQNQLVVESGKAAEYTRAYLAAISHTDAMIGQVLAALDASGHANNTDVIVWSDHGFHLGEKSHWRKKTFWEQTVKVPLLIRSPSLPVADVTDEVSLLDLAPTVLDMLGLPAEPQFEGVSLLSGRSPVEVYHDKGKAVISAGIKSIEYDTNNVSAFNVASYNLPSDPEELVNLTPPPGC